MEYFCVHDPKKALLRAKFATSAEEETCELGMSFAPVTRRLMASASQQEKLRMGFKGAVGSGKSPLAGALIHTGIAYQFASPLLFNWSVKYTTPRKGLILHFDANALKRITNTPQDNLTMRALAGYSGHKAAYAQASGHFVEWPEQEPGNSSYSALWNIERVGAFTDRSETSADREIALYTTDEIAAMPEFQEFLQNAQPYILG